MNTLHIFGDSFSDDVENNFFLPKGNETDFRWYNAIRQNSYLINHSKGAIGPQYCFHKFLSFFDTFRENDNVVLVMSQRTRLQFPFLRSDNDAPACHALLTTELNDEEVYLTDWSHEIRLVFDMFNKEIKYFPFLFVLLLNYFSKKLKVKILVLPAFNSMSYDNDFDIQFFNDDNFKVCDFDLHTISEQEFVDNQIKDHVEQKRWNHLSKQNHETLFNVCSNFFYNTDLPEKFHENLYDESGESITRFIYA